MHSDDVRATTAPFVVRGGRTRLADAMVDIKATRTDSAGDAVDPAELDRIGRRHGARTLAPPLAPRREDHPGEG